MADSTPDKKKVAELDKLVKAAEATYDAATDKASEIEVKVKIFLRHQELILYMIMFWYKCIN